MRFSISAVLDMVGRSFSLLIICCLTCALVWAQSTAQINGTVKDQTGAVLPGVEITVTQTDTGISRSTITDETGSFVLPNLATGPYRLEASLPGFRTYAQTGIVLQVNSNPVINPILEVGQVTEQVEVQANAAMVETRKSGVGQVIENERILELPLNGRNAAELITLSGAAVQTGGGGNQSFKDGVSVSIAGGLSYGVSFILDGAMHNNPWDNTNLPLPFPDALQEFKLETSGLSAQNGMHSGGAVNAVMKSGTNELHGTLFEFVRNGKFNARNAFAKTNDSLKRNQFGATVGGPIKKNKLFFFAGYQGTTVRQDPSANISYVPTAAIFAGDWTDFASPACNAGRQITLRPPFVNNRIDPARYSKPALNIVGKLPKTDDPCGRLVYGTRIIENDSQAVGKVDYQWTANHSVFGRFIVTSDRIPTPYGPGRSDNLLTTTRPGFNNLAQSYALGSTYLIGANTVNSFRLVVNQTNVRRIGAVFFNSRDVGINMYNESRKFMALSITGGFGIGGTTAGDNDFNTTTYQTANDLSLVRGTHQMSFGANVAHIREAAGGASSSNGPIEFDGQAAGLGMADFMMGQLSRLRQSPKTRVRMHQWYIGLYGQDTWKMTPRLTLNYGVRWEPFFPQQLVDGKMYHFDYDAFQKRIKTQQFKNAPAGVFYPGDPGFPGKAGLYKKWLNLGPRVGLAWDVNGDGRTSVRTSYAVAYDFVDGSYHLNSVFASPWGARIELLSPTGGLENPWSDYPGGNPFPVVFDANAPFSLGGTFQNSNYDTRPTYAQSWNLSIQKQVGQDWLVSTSYLGSVIVHMWQAAEMNPAVYFPGGPCTLHGVIYNPCSTTRNTLQRRRLSLERYQDGQYIASLSQVDDGAVSHYHGLLLSVARRAARGVTINGNYTWSHCNGDPGTENGSPAASSNEDAYLYSLPLNRQLDHTNCHGDRRHVFNMTAVAETPQFGNPTVRALATGWRLSGIFRKSSGEFFTVYTGLDRALTGQYPTIQRPNQLLVNIYGDKTLRNWLNPAAFAQPALGTNGNTGRGRAIGPGTWQFDVALSRIFRIGEKQRLEFRTEAFNVTNSLRKGDPEVNLNANTFGQINSARDARIMQFALKYVF